MRCAVSGGFVPHLRIPTLLLFGMLCGGKAAIADYLFTTIDVPGVINTFATGMNNNGQIVGYYDDGTGDHGFLYTAASFTTIDVPGATNTFAAGINDNGQIVGHYSDSTGDHSFLYTAGSFTMIDVPGATSTFATGINDSGQIVGILCGGSGCRYPSRPTIGNHGFLYSAGSFTTIDVPSADYGTDAFGINDNGQVVGTYAFISLQPRASGFLYAAANFTYFRVPGVSDTFATGINDSGQVVGYYDDDTGDHGFLYTAGSFTSIDVPGHPSGINGSGQIVGQYFDNGGDSHGFLATPIPEPNALPLLTGSLIGLALALKRAGNPALRF
jgi:probable HAF family extracellular repeat protein